MEHRGGCHCGNLKLTLDLPQAPDEVRIRACGCSFCRAHNSRTASDPNGSAEIWATDWSQIELYRFGTGTADFVICRRCGVYIGAMCDTETGLRAVINTNCLDDRAAFTGNANPTDHDGETIEGRLARRAGNWTPTIIHR
ncbi:MAG TPA: hypothetical protein VHW90_07910 [Stellaceae bacterium]|nr:hypothetical protein [Stellaceae bacterium]